MPAVVDGAVKGAMDWSVLVGSFCLGRCINYEEKTVVRGPRKVYSLCAEGRGIKNEMLLQKAGGVEFAKDADRGPPRLSSRYATCA